MQSDAFFSAADYVAYRTRAGKPIVDVAPEGVVFVYDRTLMNNIAACEDLKAIDLFSGEAHLLNCFAGKIAVVNVPGIGPSSVVTALEEFIALGVKKFMSVGLAGGLQPTLKVGDFVVCSRAIRDEGVSGHYLPFAQYIELTPELRTCITTELESRGIVYTIGTTWTIDAPFRETRTALAAHQANGVLTVEMETSALAAVAECRAVEFAAAFVVSDLLADMIWDPEFRSTIVSENLKLLYEIAVASLVKGPYCLPPK